MEKEVARWLHQQLGYNAAADSTLSANCRGNLKSLWEFLMANYKSTENQRHIHNVLAKHRREQEAARQAPELLQQALQQRQHLAQLDAKAATLERTLASLQAAVESSTQDAAEQSGEQKLFKQELHETQTQALLLQAAEERMQRLMPRLHAKLSKLKGDMELARARCQASSGAGQRFHQVLQQLQQLSCAIRDELQHVVEGKFQQQQQQSTGALTAAQEQQLHSAPGIDQSVSAASFDGSSSDTPRKKAAAAAAGAGASLQDGSTAMVLAGGSSSSITAWDDGSMDSAAGAAAAAGVTAAELQPLASCKLVSGYVPSQGVQCAVLQLLQEAPELLLGCSSQLAAQASEDLTTIVDEAETALLAPLVWDVSGASAGQDPGSAATAQQPGLLAAAADVHAAAAATCPYTLPWTIPWQTSIKQQAAAAAFHAPELLVKERQQTHLQHFVKTKVAAAAAAEAETQLEQLMGAVPLLNGTAAGSWESQLAGLWLRAEGLRAEVAVLEHWHATFEQTVLACQQEEARTEDLWENIEAAFYRDGELNKVMCDVISDSDTLFEGLKSQRKQAHELLLKQLAAAGAAASSCADAGRDELAREVAIVGRLQVCGALPPQRLAAAACGAGTTGAPLATMTRLQLAAQRLSHLGRPTTVSRAFTAAHLGAAGGAAACRQAIDGGSSSSSGSGVDAAAVSALRAACSIDAVAPVRCPAALLMEVAGECRQLQQLQQQLQRLSSFCSGAKASAAHAEKEAAELQQQIEALRTNDQQQVLPALVDLLESGQQQRATKLQEVSSDVQHFWEMPAQHLLPDTTYEGKNCSQWLMEIQALHGRKRELASQRT